MIKEKKEKTVTIRMPSSVFDKGKILAEVHHRSFSNLVEWLILKNIEETREDLLGTPIQTKYTDPPAWGSLEWIDKYNANNHPSKIVINKDGDLILEKNN